MRIVVAALVAIVISGPSPAAAWGFEAHRFIMDRALALLPAQLRPLFEECRATLVERVVDLDTWRTVGFWEEGKHHFLNLDWTGYGDYPFDALPRDYTVAVDEFGRARIDRNGGPCRGASRNFMVACGARSNRMGGEARPGALT
jgi:hypothetical protein